MNVQMYACGIALFAIVGFTFFVLDCIIRYKRKRRQKEFERRRAETFRRAVTRSDKPEVYRRRHYNGLKEAAEVK